MKGAGFKITSHNSDLPERYKKWMLNMKFCIQDSIDADLLSLGIDKDSKEFREMRCMIIPYGFGNHDAGSCRPLCPPKWEREQKEDK